VTLPRTIEQIVDDQTAFWRRPHPAGEPHRWRPAVALSRRPGASGSEVARRLGAALGYDVVDRELVHAIAARTQTAEGLVERLDEKDRPLLSDVLTAVFLGHGLTAYAYRDHLGRLVDALVRGGGAVIVGRGCHLLVPPGGALRVQVTAPLEWRVVNLAEQAGLTPGEARMRIRTIEAQRSAFLRQYFRADWTDPAGFDLVVNTSLLGVDGAARAIAAALDVLATAGAAARPAG
jgi:cytidylate kinase